MSHRCSAEHLRIRRERQDSTAFLGRIGILICAMAALFYATAATAEPTVQPSERVQRNVVVRSAPSAGSQPIDALDPGEQFELVGDVPRWYQVRLPDGRTGFVSKSWTVLVDVDAAGILRAHFIDVDQGAATLLEFPCAAVMIDAGGRGTSANDHLMDYLGAFFARRADLNRRLAVLFITHDHFDHDANLRRVAERFGIGSFVYNGATDPRIIAMLQRAASARPPVPVGVITDQQLRNAPSGFSDTITDPVNCRGVDPKIRLLSGGRGSNPGWREREFANPNNHSLVIRVDHGASSFLFTGDLETPAITNLVNRYRAGDLLDVDVFAVGHHGADNGTTERMLVAMTPDIAVIPVGDPGMVSIPRSAWNYGHPRAVTIDMLERAISRQRNPAVTITTFERGEGQPSVRRITDAIYATSRDGDVIIEATTAGELRVQTSR